MVSQGTFWRKWGGRTLSTSILEGASLLVLRGGGGRPVLRGEGGWGTQTYWRFLYGEGGSLLRSRGPLLVGKKEDGT